MIKLNEFTRMGVRRQSTVRTSIIQTSNSGTSQLYLVLSPALTRELVDYMGHRVNVFYGEDFKQLIIVRGDDRAVSVGHAHGGANPSGRISLNKIKDDYHVLYSDVRLNFLDSTWETDENGNKVVLLTMTGETEKF